LLEFISFLTHVGPDLAALGAGLRHRVFHGFRSSARAAPGFSTGFERASFSPIAAPATSIATAPASPPISSPAKKPPT